MKATVTVHMSKAARFKVPASFRLIGAVQVTNYHHSEMLLGDI